MSKTLTVVLFPSRAKLLENSFKYKPDTMYGSIRNQGSGIEFEGENSIIMLKVVTDVNQIRGLRPDIIIINETTDDFSQEIMDEVVLIGIHNKTNYRVYT